MTNIAGANAYAAKFAISPNISDTMPAHQSGVLRYAKPSPSKPCLSAASFRPFFVITKEVPIAMVDVMARPRPMYLSSSPLNIVADEGASRSVDGGCPQGRGCGSRERGCADAPDGSSVVWGSTRFVGFVTSSHSVLSIKLRDLCSRRRGSVEKEADEGGSSDSQAAEFAHVVSLGKRAEGTDGSGTWQTAISWPFELLSEIKYAVKIVV